MVKKEGRQDKNVFKFGFYGICVGIILFAINLFDIDFVNSIVNFLLSPSFLFYNLSINLLTTIFTNVAAVFIFYLFFFIIEGFIVGLIVGWLNYKFRK